MKSHSMLINLMKSIHTMTAIHSFSLLHEILFCEYSVHCLTIILLMDIWVSSSMELLQTQLLEPLLSVTHGVHVEFLSNRVYV